MEQKMLETFSMNIIAHNLTEKCEMIAPGVMGINFMKPEKPINTKSDVYRLVQEEEQNKVKSPSPIPNNSPPIFKSKIPPTIAPRPKYVPPPAAPVQKQAPPAPQPLAPTPPPPVMQPVALPPPPAPKQPEGPQTQCFDCGRPISGPFMKLLDRTLHEECFQCSTCGAALKNIGYHNINNKLYCDMHARLAARVIASNLSSASSQPTVSAPLQRPADPPFIPSIVPPPQQQQQPYVLPTSSYHTVPTPYGMTRTLPQTPSSSGNLAFRSISPQPYKRMSGEYHKVAAPSSPTPGSSVHPYAYSTGPLPFESTKPYLPRDQSLSNVFASLDSAISSEIVQKTTSQVYQASHCQYSMDYNQTSNQSKAGFSWPPKPDGEPDASAALQADLGSIPAAGNTMTKIVENFVEKKETSLTKDVDHGGQMLTAEPAQIIEGPASQVPNFAPALPPIIDLKPAPVSAPAQPGVPTGAGSKPAPKKGRGQLMNEQIPGRIAICGDCGDPIRGPFIIALNRTWCPNHFHCNNKHCRSELMDIGFVEEQGQLYCENCYEAFLAPTCNKCNVRIKGDCLNALDRQWHPQCFICGYCQKAFGNNSFYLEDGLPYCEKDWNELFTTKCVACGFPIEAGDRWVEALNSNYHSQCFKCSVCQKNLEGQSFYAKGGKPYCKQHAR